MNKYDNREKECECTICGSRHHSVPFHNGFVCEDCIQYIKGF